MVNLGMEKKYHHGNLKETLLNEGFLLIKEKGIERLTLREVASKAKVSHAAPYRHFKSKEDLLFGIMEKAYAIFNKFINNNIQNISDPKEKLIKLTQSYINFALKNEDYYRLIFSKSVSKTDYSPELLSAAFLSYNILKEILHQLNPEINAELAALQSWSGLHGLLILYLDKKLPPAFQKMDGKGLLEIFLFKYRV